ncbi:hypothetical protein Tco_1174456 [Tanacetum coccineum]
MIEPEPVKKLSKKNQLKLDEEVAQRLQAEFDEQERIKREKAEANIALKETWDDIQAKIEADCLLAERLQTREQEELTIEERAKLFQQLLEKRRKHFAAKRAEEKRNKPPTKAQQRSIICTYLKNIERWKPKDLKSKSFINIQELFDKAMKRVNTFVDYRTELVEGSSKKAEAKIAQESSSKRAGDELEQESIKKQKVDEDKETAELKSLMEVIPDEEEVAVDAIPLATKPPSIVDWKIHKEGKKSYYQMLGSDLGLITTHGHKESDCIVGERKMEFTFFNQLIMVHLSLEPPGTHLEPHLKAVFFLDQKGLTLMMILMTMTKRFDADVHATNIVLQGLPKDIYKLINHNIKAKAIWDNVKMLLARYELTKEDRESQLYDEFKRFKMLLGENINEYYVRFHKLVNDIRNIRMTMPNIQLNPKFINNMSPEWDRFITVVKRNKGLKVINHEQMYAYLKQHEKHAAQDRLIIEKITPTTNDQLAFVSSVQPYAQSYTQTDEILDTLTKQVALLAQSFRNQNQRNFTRGADAAGNRGAHNRVGNANKGQGKPIKCYNYNGLGHIARYCTLLKRPRNSNFFKDKMLLMQAQENGAVLDEKELLFLDAKQTNTFDADVDDQPVRDLAQNDDNIFQADKCDASTQMLMMNLLLSQYSWPICPQLDQQIYKPIHQLHPSYLSCASSISNDAYVLHDNKAYIPHDPLKMDEQMSILIQDQNKKDENLKKELHSVKLQLNSTIKSNKIIEETVIALKHEFKQKETKFLTDFSNLKKLNDKLENKLYSQDHSIQTVHMMLKPKKLYDQDAVMAIGAQNPFYLRKAKMVQPALYDGDEILKTHHVPVSVTSSEEDLEIAEITRQKMNEKMNDPVCVEKKIKIIPPNYSKENFLATFTPQTQLTPEQVFWSKDLLKQRAEDLKTNAPPLSILPPATVYPPNTPVHLVPRTLPTTSQVNIEVIPFFNILKEHFDEVQRSLVKEVRAMKAVFENMEAEVDQNVIDKKCREIKHKNLLITNENLIANYIAHDVFYTVTDYALTASRFHDLSNAYNVAMTHVVELEAENSKLLEKKSK